MPSRIFPQRQLIEARNEAEAILLATEKALARECRSAGDLPADERTRVWTRGRGVARSGRGERLQIDSRARG